MIGLIQVGNQAIADRYMYIPIIGLLVMIVWGGYDLAQYAKFRSALRIGFASLLVAVLSFLAYRQIGFWKSSLDLWSHTVALPVKPSLPQNLPLPTH